MNDGIPQEVIYASFWKRFAASAIDVAILILVNFLIFAVLSIMESYGVSVGLRMRSIFPIIFWIYAGLMESSYLQATIGKLIFKVKVTDLSGNRASFLRATSRHFGKLLSTLPFGAGFFMVAFTEKNQGLHDMLAGCLVVSSK